MNGALPQTLLFAREAWDRKKVVLCQNKKSKSSELAKDPKINTISLNQGRRSYMSLLVLLHAFPF